uniref:Arf-GAP with Rho-GAP domain, ANK repeat and PH domain-containing protein 1-like n=1 Tax=Petromyzon marinus TaxID=7757 RepID=A0AAJ7UCP8_PETMA|nr:arf-GAP with Rho-GAP domain, ANK repeat and PH domain-containing protein 1-like [Petromyzon marinus]
MPPPESSSRRPHGDGGAVERRDRASARLGPRFSAAIVDGAGVREQHQLPLSSHPFFLGAGAARPSPRPVRSLTDGGERSQRADEEKEEEEKQEEEEERAAPAELARRSSAPPAPVSAPPTSPTSPPGSPRDPALSPGGSPRPLLKGYLYKTPSCTKPIVERRSRDEFSRRRCELSSGELRYFDGERSSTPNGRVPCGLVCSLSTRGEANPLQHGFENTFELCVAAEGERGDGERLYLFGAESEEACHDWVTQLARCCEPPPPDPLLALPWERLGRLEFRDGYCSQRWRRGWFALVRCSLFFLPDDSGDGPGDAAAAGPDGALPNGAAEREEAEERAALTSGVETERQESTAAAAAATVAPRSRSASEEVAPAGEATSERAEQQEESGGARRLDSVSLNKLRELSVMTPSEEGDRREVLVLGERRRMLCVRASGRLCSAGWLAALRKASEGRSGELSLVQLTDGDVPVIVSKCLAYVTQYGLACEGVYRKTGVNSRIAALLSALRGDARSVRLADGAFHVDDVTTALRRFLREVEPSLFTTQLRQRWADNAREPCEEAMLAGYRELIRALPPVNRATLTEIIAHLHCVQSYAALNHMTSHNLAIVFTPSLFHTEGKSGAEGLVLEHLIAHYPSLFHVSEEQLRARQQETDLIVQMSGSSCLSKERAGDMIMEVYLLHKDSDSCLSLQVSAAMTSQELAEEVLEMRPGAEPGGAPWATFEVIAGGELERALHYRQRVLDTVLQWRLHADFQTHYLIVRPHPAATAMQHYLEQSGAVLRWEGPVRLREEATRLGELLPVSRFHEKFLVVSAGVATVYRDARASRADREWAVSSLTVYRGVRKKLRPPTEFGVTVFHGRQQWYLCFDNEADFLHWHASILYTQHDGDLWGAARAAGGAAGRGAAVRRVGKRSLVSLRGEQSEIRRSLAALSAAAAAIASPEA